MAPYRSRRFNFNCYACEDTCSGFAYHCSECKFDLDILCSRFRPISHGESHDQHIQHLTHSHPLILVACLEQDYKFDCSMCEQPIKGSIYVCVTCKYFIHKSCAEWPQRIQHPFHPPHPLTILAVSHYRSENLDCYACGQISRAGYTFHCSECQLDLHIDCARFLPPNDDDHKQTIQHFSHRHPLFPVECSSDNYRFNCSGCDESIKGSIYVCSKCKFFVHKSCIELPREIHHPFHQHTLNLLPKAPYRSRKFEFDCYACEGRCFGFTYHCRECKFYLDILCSRYMPDTHNENHNLQIQHFTHQHPLILFTCYKDVYRFKCSLCKNKIKDSMYVCAKCKFFVHKSCVELPQQIQHPFHPLHPLILHKSSDLKPVDEGNLRRCHACTSECKGLTFHCSICRFDLDSKCAMQMCNIDIECHGQQIQHRSHQHALFPFDAENSKLLCSACTQFLDGSSYICPQCVFVVHKSCAELPEEIQHRFHPQHPLTVVALESGIGEKRLCKACGSHQYSGFTYNCAVCDFNLDLECASLKLTIKYEHHEHPLLPMDRDSDDQIGDFQCSKCSSRCRGFFLRCVPCDLSLHVKCIPALPRTAKHITHRHTLTLSDPLPEDDSDEYYCDACEKERNPKHFVYYCAKCEFVAHIDCAVPKPLPAVPEESYVARQVREAGFILSDSEGREDWEGSEDWEEEDENEESDATDSSLAALDKEIEALTAKLESLKQERASHILMSNKRCLSEGSTSD